MGNLDERTTNQDGSGFVLSHKSYGINMISIDYSLVTTVWVKLNDCSSISFYEEASLLLWSFKTMT
jgi:hypothetical protein